MTTMQRMTKPVKNKEKCDQRVTRLVHSRKTQTAKRHKKQFNRHQGNADCGDWGLQMTASIVLKTYVNGFKCVLQERSQKKYIKSTGKL